MRNTHGEAGRLSTALSRKSGFLTLQPELQDSGTSPHTTVLTFGYLISGQRMPEEITMINESFLK